MNENKNVMNENKTKTALVLVDLQNDFMPGGALAVEQGDQTVAIANQLMPAYDLVVATQDWHPADHGSFAANYIGKNIFDTVDLNGLEQILWPVHCVQGSDGAEFHKDLQRQNIHRIFPKGCDPTIDSYSGFFDNGKRQATGLGDYLKEQAVDRVDVMGLATDYCVKFTALDAQALGFQTRLIVAGSRAVNMNAGDEQAALDELEAAGVELLQEIAQEIESI